MHEAERTTSLNDQASQRGLFEWLVNEARGDPQREAFVEFIDGEATVLRLSDLSTRSQSLAASLASLEVARGSVVGLWLPNQLEWAISQFAVSALDATVLGLNTRFRSHEMTHLFQTVPPKVVVLASSFLGIDFIATLKETFHECRRHDPTFQTPTLIFLDEVPEAAYELATTCRCFGDLLSEDPGDVALEHPSALSNLFTTSGSTSAPKVAGHDQVSIVRHARAGAMALGVRKGDRLLAALPLCGVFGFNSVLATLVGGGSALLMRSFEPATAARYLQGAGVTHVVGGDEMLSAIFRAVAADAEVPHLRRGGIANFTGHAKNVVEEADRRWGAKIAGVYGSSELFALSAIWPESAPLSLRTLQGGHLVDEGIEVRVADLETGAVVSDGVPGELQFRGYNVIDGYVNNEEASNLAFTHDGWFRTGDLGYLFEGGFVYQCRAREVLRLRGFLVEPGEIEEFLSGDPSVAEAHVVGVDTEGGTKAFAFVRPREGERLDEVMMLRRAKERLANYKVPERILSVDEFPTTTGTNGTKVRFEELRERARALLAAEDH